LDDLKVSTAAGIVVHFP